MPLFRCSINRWRNGIRAFIQPVNDDIDVVDQLLNGHFRRPALNRHFIQLLSNHNQLDTGQLVAVDLIFGFQAVIVFEEGCQLPNLTFGWGRRHLLERR